MDMIWDQNTGNNNNKYEVGYIQYLVTKFAKNIKSVSMKTKSILYIAILQMHESYIDVFPQL